MFKGSLVARWVSRGKSNVFQRSWEHLWAVTLQIYPTNVDWHTIPKFPLLSPFVQNNSKRSRQTKNAPNEMRREGVPKDEIPWSLGLPLGISNGISCFFSFQFFGTERAISFPLALETWTGYPFSYNLLFHLWSSSPPDETNTELNMNTQLRTNYYRVKYFPVQPSQLLLEQRRWTLPCPSEDDPERRWSLHSYTMCGIV